MSAGIGITSRGFVETVGADCLAVSETCGSSEAENDDTAVEELAVGATTGARDSFMGSTDSDVND